MSNYHTEMIQRIGNYRRDAYDGLSICLFEIETSHLICDSLIVDGDIDNVVEDDLGTL